MESLIKDINLNSEDSQGINWKEYEQYLNHFDESCMGSEEFLNYCNKMAEEIRKNHRDMYKSSAMQCVRDVASCKKDVSINDFCKLSERGCFVNILDYFQKNILNKRMDDFEKGVCAYFGLMLAYITNEQAVHIIPDTFFGGKLFLENSLCKDATVGDPSLAFFDLDATGFFFNMMKICFLSCFKPKVFKHIQNKGNRISRIHPFLPCKQTLVSASKVPENFEINDYISSKVEEKGLSLRMLDRENPRIMTYRYSFNKTDEALVNLFFMFYNNFDYLAVTIPHRKNLLSKIMPKIMRHV